MRSKATTGWPYPHRPTKFPWDPADLYSGRAELDPKKRYEISCEAQKLCSDNSGSLIATHSAYVDGVSSKLKGFRKVPIESFGGMEFPEYIWLDA